MTNRTPKLYLKDIVDSIDSIMAYTKGISFEKFAKDKMKIDAVVRNFEIIGEATKHIPIKIRNAHTDIPWKEMAGMRDKIIHEYFGVDLEIVWKTIKSRLPKLKKTLLAIVNSL